MSCFAAYLLSNKVTLTTPSPAHASYKLDVSLMTTECGCTLACLNFIFSLQDYPAGLQIGAKTEKKEV